MSSVSGDDLLTLEPLLEAVRAGVEEAGWELSGLQKTTSHQFEGRWEGESTRSAYLFFHRPLGEDAVSIDVYLDETSRGLTGNLALVADLAPLGSLGDPVSALDRLKALSERALPVGRRRPVTLRFRLDDAAQRSVDAESEIRFKVRIPRSVIASGAGAVRVLARESVEAFEAVLGSPELQRFLESP